MKNIFAAKIEFLRITALFFAKVWKLEKITVPLHHENPPSLFTMLKSAGRVLLWAKIDTLISNYPDIDIAAMGFPREWGNEPLWQ